jgi:formate-dependent nitrite reductase membrane component NrfD
MTPPTPQPSATLPQSKIQKPGSTNPQPPTPNPQSYYGIPPIKKPHWKWEIVLYFFLGGVASGAYTIATLAEVYGDRRHRPIIRAGRYIALPCLLVSPILLIKDLGKPIRFFNMLRVFKIKSPMSMGTWGLVAFSGFAALSTAAELAEQGVARGTLPARLALLLPRRLIGRAGSFFALFVGGYTGVLLSATTVPLWAKNKYLLGPTFISSALSTGAAAINLALAATGHEDAQMLAALERTEAVSLTSELTMLAAQGVASGRLAQPLLTGKYSTLFVPGIVMGVLLPLLAALNGIARGHRTRAGRIATSLLTLIGGVILRWTLVYAGKDSADDPQAYFEMTR